MSNSLDPDQARHFVRPDLGSNCLQRLSAGKELILLSAKPLAKVNFIWLQLFLLAKVLALTNSEPG